MQFFVNYTNKIISRFSRMRIIDFLVIAVLSLIPLLWIPDGQILTGHDSGYPINVLEAYKNRFYTWNSQDSMGVDNENSISVIPILSLQAFVSYLGVSVANSETITFIFWFFIMQTSMYMLAHSLREHISYRWFPLLAAVLYVFNFYLLALWRYGAGTTFSAYSALPLTLLFILRMLNGKLKPMPAGLFVSLTLFFFNGGGGLSIPLFGGMFVSLSWAVIYFFLISKKQARLNLVLRIVGFSIAFFCASIFLQAYWLLPFLYFVLTTYYTTLEAVGGKEVVLKWTDSVSLYTSIANLFRLQGYPDWYNNPFHPYANAFLQRGILVFISTLIAPSAFAAVLLAKKTEVKKLIIFFFGLALLGIFFAAGSHPPTGWLYSMLILHIPGFVVFRSAQYKFIPALLLSFSLMLAYTINFFLYETKLLASLREKQRVVRAGLAIGIIVLILIYHYPFFQRGFFYYSKSLSTLIAVPEYVKKFDIWSKKHFDDEGRTLILPRFNSSWKAGLFNWNYFSLYSPFNLITPKPFIQYSYYLNESQLALFNRMAEEIPQQSELAGELLDFFQVRHILLAKDISYTSEDIPSENWKKYEKGLQQYPLLWNEGQWSVRKVPEYQPNKIYALSSLTKFHGQGSQVIGALLDGVDDFLLPQMIGKSMNNPTLKDFPVSRMLYAASCLTCSLYKQENEIIPGYTSVLPGSLFYHFKRKREQIPIDVHVSFTGAVTSRLGLTTKRIAEVISMVEQQRDSSALAILSEEIAKLWSDIDAYLYLKNPTQEQVDMVTQVHDYALSQRKILTRLRDNHAQNAEVLMPVISTLQRILKKIEEYRNTYENTAVYRVPASMHEAEIFFDRTSLPHTSNDTYVLPTSLVIENTSYPVRAIFTNGKVGLGKFSLTEGQIIAVKFPSEHISFPEQNYVNVTVDTTQMSCVGVTIPGFDAGKSYEMTIKNAASLDKSALFYLRKRKNESTISLQDTRFKPDTAFNFDKLAQGAQRKYFSGTDGDVGAYLYLCVDTNVLLPAIEDTISIRPLSSPPLFFRAGNGAVMPRQKILYNRIDQTKYTIDLNNASFPLILVFNENYNELWRLSETDATGGWWQILTQWRVPSFSRSSHLQINGFANAWYIPQKPESGKLILEFYPQSLFYKGLVISLVSLIIVGLLLRKQKK